MTRHATDNEVAEAVEASVSYVGVLRLLGRRTTGGSANHISKRISRLGLDTSHFTGQGWNRGGISSRRLKPEEILTVRSDDAYRQQSHLLRRAMLESGVEYRCECGNAGTWQGKPLTLEVDHIDGNWLDSRIENVRFLCPNCHSVK